MKRMKYMVVLLMTTMTVVGCGNKIPSMTQQEQDVVTEYAAATFLKYSGKYEDKLLIEAEEKDLQEEEVVEEEIEIEKEVMEGTESQENELADVPTISANAGESGNVIVSEGAASVSLAQFIGAEKFSIEYEGFEICDSYSGAAEGELAFGMEASAGKKLMIVKYNVLNLTSEEQKLDVFSKNVKAKVGAAGLNKSALLTMLENDLLTADVVFAPNESKIYVIVVEVPEGKVADMAEVSLEFSCNGKQANYTY